MDDVTRRVYADQGYCRLKNCLPSAVVEAVHAEAQAIFATQMDRLGIGAVDDANDFDRRLYELFQVDHAAFLAAARQCQQSIAMHRLAVSSDVMDIVTALGLELPTICVKPIIYFNSPRLAKIEGHYKTPPIRTGAACKVA